MASEIGLARLPRVGRNRSAYTRSVRAPFQVLVIGFRTTSEGTIEYLALKRGDLEMWQPIAGGGEGGESPPQAARREALEEAGIPSSSPLFQLSTVNSIPVSAFAARDEWSPDLYVIPEYTFGIDCGEHEVVLSPEHTAFRWLFYDDATESLHWQANRVALLELSERIARGDLTPL